MAYSMDLRKRAMELLEAGKSQTEISELLGINRKTLYEWKQRDGELGTWYPSRRGAYHIDEAAIKAHLEKEPDAYLSELATVAGGTAQGVRHALKRMGITRKKRQLSTSNEMKAKEQLI